MNLKRKYRTCSTELSHQCYFLIPSNVLRGKSKYYTTFFTFPQLEPTTRKVILVIELIYFLNCLFGQTIAQTFLKSVLILQRDNCQFSWRYRQNLSILAILTPVEEIFLLNDVYSGQANTIIWLKASFTRPLSSPEGTYAFILPWALIQEAGIHFQKSLWSKALNLHRIGNNGVDLFITEVMNTSAEIFSWVSSWWWGSWKSVTYFKMCLKTNKIKQTKK